MNRIDTSKKQSFELYISVILMVVLLASVILSLLSYINNRRALGQIDSDTDAQPGSAPVDGIFGDFVMWGDSLSEYYGAGGDIVFDESEYGYTEDSITINTGAFNQIRLDEYGIVPKTVYLGDAVTRIEARAFYATTAEEIRLPRGLGYIGAGAFADSPNLRRVYFDALPLAELEIDPRAFEGSVNVELVNFPEDIVFGENNVITSGGAGK